MSQEAIRSLWHSNRPGRAAGDGGDAVALIPASGKIDTLRWPLPSWPGEAGACGGGPDKPGHDDDGRESALKQIGITPSHGERLSGRGRAVWRELRSAGEIGSFRSRKPAIRAAQRRPARGPSGHLGILSRSHTTGIPLPRCRTGSEHPAPPCRGVSVAPVVR